MGLADLFLTAVFSVPYMCVTKTSPLLIIFPLMAYETSDLVALSIVVVVVVCAIAAARSICRQANLRSNESGYIYFATCIVCHVVYRVNVVIQGESFVCSSCFNEQQTIAETNRIQPRIVDVPLSLKYFHRVTSTYFEVATSQPVDQSPCNDACTICYDNPATCVLLSCGHGGLCGTCADSLLLKSKKCHICRSVITSVAHCQDSVIMFGRTLES